MVIDNILKFCLANVFINYKQYIYVKLTFLKKFMLKKTSASKDSDIIHYWELFKIKGSSFNNMSVKGVILMMSINLSNIANLNINSADYRCIINRIKNIEAVNLLQKAGLNEKCQTL